MTALSPSVLEALGIQDAPVDDQTHLLNDLHLTQEQVIAVLDQRFPLLLIQDNSDQEVRRNLFTCGMEDASLDALEAKEGSGIVFGQAWTVGRLKAALVKLENSSYPDNVGD